jgi:hypothetical protein
MPPVGLQFPMDDSITAMTIGGRRARHQEV